MWLQHFRLQICFVGFKEVAYQGHQRIERMRAVISDHIEQPVEDQGDLLIIAFGLDVSDGCFSARIMV